MSKLVSSKWPCKCGHENAFKFIKPSHFTPTMVAKVCSGCGSTWRVIIEKKKFGGPREIKYIIEPITLSEKFLLLLKAQAVMRKEALQREKEKIEKEIIEVKSQTP